MVSYQIIAKVIASFIVTGTFGAVLFTSDRKNRISSFTKVKFFIFISIIMYAIWS
jgi:hypothetical protein